MSEAKGRPRALAAGLAALLVAAFAAPPLTAQAPESGEPAPAATAEPAPQEGAAAPAGEGDGEGEDESVPSAEELGVFVDTLEVTIVNVEVFVTDKKGNRVTGLTRDDFEIEEDGRPMEITNFYAVEGRRPVRAEPAAAAPEAPEAPPGAPEPEPELPEDQRLYLIVYIDNFNIDPLNRNRVFRDLRLFLADQLQIGDKVMLVSYDRSIKVRRPFTSDPHVIASALSELERLTGWGRQRESDRRDRLDRIQDARSGSEALLWARGWADEVNNDMRFTIDALKELVNSLAGLPGRKAVLYVSDGVPMVAGEDLFHAVQEKFSAESTSAITESFSYNMARQFTELAAQANANRITFYTLDAAGLRVASDFSAENRNVPISGVDSVHTHNLQAPLRYVAQATGGIAILNTNRAAPLLERVAEDFNTYYSLGYRAPESGRGRYHKIDVKVKGGKGLVVRHREGYRDKTVDARMTDSTLSALHFPDARNPLGVDLGFGTQTARDDRFYVVAVEVLIPIGEIVLVPRGETHEGRVRLFIAAIDEEDRTSPVQQLAVPISIPAEDLERARQQRYQYTASLLMRSGPHTVAVGVRDELGGEDSIATGRVTVGR